MRYSTLQLNVVVVICIVMAACASSTTQSVRETFTFDYTPATEAVPGSADITFAAIEGELVSLFQSDSIQSSITFWVGSPSWGYQEGMMEFSPTAPVPLFEDFTQSMTKDYMEVLNAHGYGVKGPFKTYDEMIHPDKQGSDLILTSKIEFKIDYAQVKWLWEKNDKWDPGEPERYFAPSGSIAIGCTISFAAAESLTNERMWTKKINLTSVTVVIPKTPKFGGKLSSENLLMFLMKSDNIFHSQVGSALVTQYDNIGKQIHAYLDPREMAIVKNQAMELRKRKVY